MFKFNYTLDDKDYIDFNLYCYNNTSVYKILLLLAKVLVPVILAIIPIYDFISRGSSAALIAKVVVFVIFSGCWIIFAKRLINSVNILTMKAIKKDGKLPYGKNVQIQFNDDGIFETTEMAESKFKYSSIEKTVESDKALYVFLGAVQAIIIPFSAFESKLQRAEFIEYINRRSSGL